LHPSKQNGVFDAFLDVGDGSVAAPDLVQLTVRPGDTVVVNVLSTSVNSAQLCQGGWQTLLRSDGSSFANQGACVAYAAQGGALLSLSCARAGGTFGVGGPDLVQGGAPGAGVIWVCNSIPTGSLSFNFLLAQVEVQCADDNGIGVVSGSDRPGEPVNFTCYDRGGG
jgi:hypothetical protein